MATGVPIFVAPSRIVIVASCHWFLCFLQATSAEFLSRFRVEHGIDINEKLVPTRVGHADEATPHNERVFQQMCVYSDGIRQRLELYKETLCLGSSQGVLYVPQFAEENHGVPHHLLIGVVEVEEEDL